MFALALQSCGIVKDLNVEEEEFAHLFRHAITSLSLSLKLYLSLSLSHFISPSFSLTVCVCVCERERHKHTHTHIPTTRGFIIFNERKSFIMWSSNPFQSCSKCFTSKKNFPQKKLWNVSKEEKRNKTAIGIESKLPIQWSRKPIYNHLFLLNFCIVIFLLHVLSLPLSFFSVYIFLISLRPSISIYNQTWV